MHLDNGTDDGSRHRFDNSGSPRQKRNAGEEAAKCSWERQQGREGFFFFSSEFARDAGCAFVSEVWEGDGGQEKLEETRAGRLFVGASS